MNFTRITPDDNEKYISYLKQCAQIPADWFPAMLWGYDELVPCERAYADGLCWQHVIEHGESFYYPPIGNWDEADWQKIFSEHVKPGTVFNYVPKYLKEIWEKEFSNFEISTNRDKWDYIYDLRTFAAGTNESRKFKKENEYRVEKITADNLNEILCFAQNQTELIKKRHPNDDCTELDEDNLCQARVFSKWDSFPMTEGIMLRVKGELISYAVWDIVGDRVAVLFNKNDYKYRGVHEIIDQEIGRINLEHGRRYLNYTCDAGISGLRKAKELRNPVEMLEKYRMKWA